MADETREVIIDVELEDKDFDKEIADVNTQLRKNRQEIKELSKDYENNAKQIARLEAENRDLSKSKRQLIKESQTEANSLNALRLRLASLTRERNETNTATEEGSRRFNELQLEIRETSDALSELEQEGGDYRRNVGNYVQDTKVFGTSVGDLTSALTTTAGAIGAVVAAGTALIKVYTSSARGANDLARASDRLDSVITGLGNSLADATGEAGFFDTLLAGLQLQLFGLQSFVESTLVVTIRESLREQEVQRLEIERNAKAQLDAAEQLRQIRDEERNSFEERRAANDALSQEIDERERITVEFLEERLELLNALLKLDEENLELQQSIKQVEFEIADAREEAQGFRSEQLANDLALSRELTADRIALTEAELQAEILRTEEATERRLELEIELVRKRTQLLLQDAGENELRRQAIIKNGQNEEEALRQAFREREIEAEKQTQAELDKLVEDAIAEENKRLDAQAKKEEQLEKDRIARDKERVRREQETIKLIIQAETQGLNAIADLAGQGTALAKAAALTQVAIDTGRAISSLTAASEGNPANAVTFGGAGVAQFAAGLARILANIAQAKNIINSASGSFSASSVSTGGGGGTSVSGVSSSFEGFNNVNAALLSQFGESPRNNQALSDSFGDAVSQLPPSQVAVTEINRVNNRRNVKVTEANLA